jgi:hypothetical protein
MAEKIAIPNQLPILPVRDTVLFPGAVLPLATAYSISEALGFEKGVSSNFREAPIFLGIFTFLIALGALIAMMPGLPLIRVLIITQVINGLLLPVILVAVLRLVNNRELMGSHVNGPLYNLAAWLTTFVVSGLSVLLIAARTVNAVVSLLRRRGIEASALDVVTVAIYVRRSSVFPTASSRRNLPQEHVCPIVVHMLRLVWHPAADRKLVRHDPCTRTQFALQLRFEPGVHALRQPQRHDRCLGDVCREQVALDKGDLVVDGA